MTPGESHLHLLILEDREERAEQVAQAIRRAGTASRYTVANTREAFIAALNHKPDLVLVTPGFTAIDMSEALAIARRRTPGVPFVVLTGAASERITDGEGIASAEQRRARFRAALMAAMTPHRSNDGGAGPPRAAVEATSPTVGHLTGSESTAERLETVRRLRVAVERKEFVLHYQPRVNLDTGAVIGLEALLRWKQPDGSLAQPSEFIRLLEQSGTIVAVGEWVLDAACAQIREWMDADIAPVRISVNLSARQLNAGLDGVMSRTLAAHRVPPDLLEVEVTEGSLAEDPDEASSSLLYVKALGVRLTIDDFGTGTSSLNCLTRFTVDGLKIDRELVTDITVNEQAAVIAETLVHLGLRLGLDVVAEGVETTAQLRLLRDAGCTQAQGYLFAKPLTAEHCTALLRSRVALPVPAG